MLQLGIDLMAILDKIYVFKLESVKSMSKVLTLLVKHPFIFKLRLALYETTGDVGCSANKFATKYKRSENYCVTRVGL